jgi:hypothetical protein
MISIRSLQRLLSGFVPTWALTHRAPLGSTSIDPRIRPRQGHKNDDQGSDLVDRTMRQANRPTVAGNPLSGHLASSRNTGRTK